MSNSIRPTGRGWKFASALLLVCTLATPAGAQFLTPNTTTASGAQTTNAFGETYVNQGLVGAGRLAASARDKYNDTLGSFSAFALDLNTWRRVGDSYTGVLYTLPDRGYNTDAFGFSNFAGRVHSFDLSLTPKYDDAVLPQNRASQNQVTLTYRDTLLLTDFNGNVTTGLDPGTSTASQNGVGPLPIANSGLGANKISIDAEGLAFLPDGSFYVSDEYAAAVYYFNKEGELQGVILPPKAISPETPLGTTNYNSTAAPSAGRRNNQGMEGASVTPDGNKLVVMLQSGTIQDTPGGQENRKNTRILIYDISENRVPTNPVEHYAITLPTFDQNGNGSGLNRTAASSEIFALNDNQFLVLSRDGNGYGNGDDNSPVFKSILLVDTTGATNLAGTTFETTNTTPISPGATLNPTITPVQQVQLVNMLNTTQLNRFGMNLSGDAGQPTTSTALSEKWEALAVAPVLEESAPQDFFLFVGNDNDFETANGNMSGNAPGNQAYSDPHENDSIILVYRLTLPGYVDPMFLQAMKITSPALLSKLYAIGFDQARGNGQAVFNQLNSMRQNGFIATASAAIETPVRQVASVADGTVSDASVAQAPAATRSAGVNVWASGQYRSIDQDQRNGLTENKTNEFSGRLGLDYMAMAGFRIGAAVGAGGGKSKFEDNSLYKSSAFSASLYAAFDWKGFFLQGAYTFTWQDFDTLRRQGAYGTTPEGDTEGRAHAFDAQAGYRFRSGDGWSFGPTFGLSYVSMKIDGYVESGGAGGNVVYRDQKVSSLLGTADFEIAKAFRSGTTVIVPSVHVGYEAALKKDDEKVTLSLASAPGGLGTQTLAVPSLAQNFVVGGASIQAIFGNTALRVGYDYRHGSKDATIHTLFTGLSLTF